MPDTNRKPSPKETVLQKYPDAFVYDDGGSVYIMTMKTVIEKCPTCRQEWTHRVIDYCVGALGSGGTESYAWESAAKGIQPYQQTSLLVWGC